MSVVSGILSGLEYVRRMRWRIALIESGFVPPSRRVPYVELGCSREYFSPSCGMGFNREELSRRAINESLARMPIAR
jgi:hypothetical protein